MVKGGYGILTNVFQSYPVDEAVKRIKENKINTVQLYFAFDGGWWDVTKLTIEEVETVKKAFRENGIEVAALGGSYNLASFDKEVTDYGVAALKKLIDLAPEFKTDLVVTELGSTSEINNWTPDERNDSEAVWKNFVTKTKKVVEYAAKRNIIIAVEPHFGQVLSSADKLRKLIDEINLPNLKVAMDPANIVTKENEDILEDNLEELFAKVGKDIVIAHTKDTKIAKNKSVFCAAGKGILPYQKYIELLEKYHYEGSFYLEFLPEKKIGETIAFLQRISELVKNNIPNPATINVPGYLLPIFESDASFYNIIAQAQDSVHGKEGALPLKYRLLITVVADALRNHQEGAVACAREALEAGATKEELKEAMRVVYTAGGLTMLLENIAVYNEVILK